MQTTNFTTTLLKPEEGFYLTEKANVEIKDRTVATIIALCESDSADNYIEIDEETAQNYLQQQEELRNLEREESDKNISIDIHKTNE